MFEIAGTGEIRSLAVIQSVSTRIMVGELLTEYNDIGAKDWSDSGNNNFRDSCFAGHLATWNCLFADGHVKSLRPVRTMVPMNMWGRFNDQSDSDGPNCGNNPDDYNPDCEAPSPGALAHLQDLEARYK